MDWYYLRDVSEFPYLPIHIKIEEEGDSIQYIATYKTPNPKYIRQISYDEYCKNEQPLFVPGTDEWSADYGYETDQIVERTKHFLKNVDLDKNEYRSKCIKKDIIQYIKSLREELETDKSGYDQKFWKCEIDRLQKKWKLRRQLTQDQALYITDLIHKVVWNKYRAPNAIKICESARSDYVLPLDEGDSFNTVTGRTQGVVLRKKTLKVGLQGVFVDDLHLERVGSDFFPTGQLKDTSEGSSNTCINALLIRNFQNSPWLDPHYILHRGFRLIAFNAVVEHGYVIIVRLLDKNTDSNCCGEFRVVCTQLNIDDNSSHRYKFVKDDKWDLDEYRIRRSNRYAPSIAYYNGQIFCSLGYHENMKDDIWTSRNYLISTFATIDIKSSKCFYLHDSCSKKTSICSILRSPSNMFVFQRRNGVCYIHVRESSNTTVLLTEVHFFVNRNGIRMHKKINVGGYFVRDVQHVYDANVPCESEKFTFYLHCYRNNMVNSRFGHIKEFSVIKVEV